jgi:hypothetical protein
MKGAWVRIASSVQVWRRDPMFFKRFAAEVRTFESDAYPGVFRAGGYR